MTHFDSEPHEPELPFGDSYSEGGDINHHLPHDFDSLGVQASDAYDDSGIIRDPHELPAEHLEVAHVSDRQPEDTVPYKDIAAARRERVAGRLADYTNEAGIDVEFAGHFTAALDIPKRPHLIIAQQHIPELAAVLQDEGLAPVWNEGGARYYASLGLSIVVRSDDPTGRWTQTSLVHEDVHSSLGVTDEPDARLTDEQLALWRPADGREWVGFADRSGNGILIEEGFAHWITTEFEEYSGADRGNTYPYGLMSGMPEKYNTDEGYSPGAVALEVLCAKDEALIELLFAGRQDADAYAEARQRIDRIQPWLSGALLSIPTASENSRGLTTYQLFDDGLNLTLEATGYSRDDIDSIVNTGPAAGYIVDKLNDYTRRTGYQF